MGYIDKERLIKSLQEAKKDSKEPKLITLKAVIEIINRQEEKWIKD